MVLGLSSGEQGPLDVQQLGSFPRGQVRRGEPLEGPALRRRQAIGLGPSTPGDRLRALEQRYDAALEELRELRAALTQLPSQDRSARSDALEQRYGVVLEEYRERTYRDDDW